jgi:hypothetical protein
MIYRSNLTCPDLQPDFEPLICKPRPNTMGHDALSDPDFEPDCLFFTHDEAAILYNVVKECRGRWVDIGSRTGWTSRHITAPGGVVVDCVDVGYRQNPRLEIAFWKNLDKGGKVSAHGETSFEYFHEDFDVYTGACIDGNHDAPFPLVDAVLCATHGARVIVFHDFWGPPIQEAVTFLKWQGWKAKIYNTPNGVAVCWRGEFTPPDHTPDPSINWEQVWKRVTRYSE